MDVVVFGAGYWGRNYVRELGKHCKLVIDIDPEAKEDIEERFGVEVVPDLPSGYKFDGAVVATPPMNHFRVAHPLLEQGKYVLIEKPMATTYEQAAQLASYPKCMAGLVYCYHPETAFLCNLVDEQGGAIRHVFSRRTNYGPVRPYLNAMWDLAAHDISIFNRMFSGPPKTVHCTGDRDAVVLQMDYYIDSLRVPTFCYASWHGPPKTRRVEVVFESERHIFDDVQIALEEPPLTRMVKAFLSGEWDRCSGKEGAEVVRVLELAK